MQRINDIVGQLSKDTLASIEFIRLSDYDRHDVATDVATELLVYALYKTGAEVTDIRLFIVSCQGNLRFQSREELALAPPGRFFCIMNQSFDYA